MYYFIRVYLVVVDIRIVDCHMYPGEPCPPSHVLSYIPAEASMQYIHNIIRISILSYQIYSNKEPPTWISSTVFSELTQERR